MNAFEQGLLTYLQPEQLEKIQNVRIGIAGAGGLGSNCAVNLVRSGFRRLVIADFDTVAPSNLNRQFFFAHQIDQPKVQALADNLRAINDNLELTLHPVLITRENIHTLFAECAIVVEAFDQVGAKQLLIEELSCSGKLLVAASGLAGWQNSDAIQTHKLGEKFYLIGDLQTAIGPGRPPLSPRVQIAAAKQANVILNYVLTVAD
ncbi:sulfur carrier protein ThiS adenylyltransferase ThiF [Heliophilum fasciatum]|uniref:Sulfur carrier protein ThiS adenylyltransferase n=1 Tax=Heliophilum fasciatum TaxID=35700 RepID=A0A4R2RYU0_9FIRM|nr:sulfur carrier protein ThiS adenylyltransferase ThiF [Heliophilum fasciatum]MCW2277528.1 sulfur carrier protein ThiS adenylyltransferase [Heliophilum fasciatum]TCP65181.1 sulfur carrier protein ThiS adenylyltransferase [Heliophilum fasciatum]